ncbi:hypothetical protein Ae201684P_016580 [Aphanomyces euteiches]|nr:hypothetical protein Ae201684P_016580 [Aphanomyces euteiches]
MSTPTDADVMPMFFLNPGGGPSSNDKKEEDSSTPAKSSYASLPRQNYQNPWEANAMGMLPRPRRLQNRHPSFETQQPLRFQQIRSLHPSRPSSTPDPQRQHLHPLNPQQSLRHSYSQVSKPKNGDTMKCTGSLSSGFPSKIWTPSSLTSKHSVVQYRYGRGNWLYIRYRTRLQAEKALQESGSTLSGRIMIGTKRCLAWEMDADAPVCNLTDTHAPPAPLLSRDLQVNPPEIDVMESPRRQDDMCSRFLRFLFNV